MQLQDVLFFLFWAGLFFVMMRFGCGAHIMGHGHHHRSTSDTAAPRTESDPCEHAKAAIAAASRKKTRRDCC
jgi:hypothetical protein